MNQPIVDFYSGKTTDTSGRTLREIHTWGYNELENVHDYIQWLFPLAEPILDTEQIAKFHADAELHAQLLASLDMMLGFYGFQRNNLSIVRSNSWEERSRNWLRLGNHNHLRLTRILKSLSLLGLKDHATALFEVLIAVVSEKSSAISNTTVGYWNIAILGS